MMFESLPTLPEAQRWHQQAAPTASVLAIIRRDGTSQPDKATSRYLLIRRQSEPYIGKWGLVGGRWEFGETLETAITREVKEETDLDATFIALHGVVNERIAPFSASDNGAHFLLFVCELFAPTGTASEQSEGPIAWFDLEELNQLGTDQQIISSDFTILQHFAQRRSALAYVEADVIAGGSEKAAGQLVHFSERTRSQ